jgi:pyruvate formate lyase activating enzyme
MPHVGLQLLPAAFRLSGLVSPAMATLQQAFSRSLHMGPATATVPAPSSSMPAFADAHNFPDVPGVIHSTESFSALDGPGVRFLVFLQGCGMRCLFCSNPDTWELHSGTRTSSKTVAAEIRKVLPYLRESGGVTCSGGEPLLQPDFVAALFREAHAMNLTTCIDTTGQGSKHHNWDIVLPHTDMVLFCIKHLDPDKYQKLTGIKQTGALKFAAELESRGIPYYLRYVLLPEMSDSPEDIRLLIEFSQKQKALQAIELLPYHLLGKDKWDHLGYKYPLEGMKTPSREHVHAIRQRLEDAGLTVLCDVK